MPLLSLDPFLRSAILTCDGCDHLLTIDGRRSERPCSEHDPDALALHYDNFAELRARALTAGWLETRATKAAPTRWSCPACRVDGRD